MTRHTDHATVWLALAILPAAEAAPSITPHLFYAPSVGLALAAAPTPAAQVQSPRRAQVLAFAEQVSALARAADVIPMRFGVTFTHERQIIAQLEARASSIWRTLERLRGHTEVAVHAPLPEVSPSPAPRRQTSAPAGAGLSYLMRRRAERAAELRHRERVLRARDELAGFLGALATEVHVEPDRAPEAPRASIALLTPRQRLDALAARLAAHDPPLTYLGPFPPYSFAELDLE